MKKIIFLSLLLVFVFSGIAMATANWVAFGHDGEGSIRFIDLASFRYVRNDTAVDKNIVSLWIKFEYSQLAKDKKISEAKNDGIYTEEWDDVDHVIVNYRVNISDKTYTPININYYDSHKNCLLNRFYLPS